MSTEKNPQGRKLIRHYVQSLSARHGGESYRIPSSRELAAQFGVARCTVTRELEQLIREGVLVAKHGVGTFLALTDEFRRRPLVGILYSYGNHYFYTDYSWRMISAIGNALVDRQYLVRPVIISSADNATALRELQENFLDALIWIQPAPAAGEILRQLAGELKPVSVLRPEEGINSVCVAYGEQSYEEGKLLLAEGRRVFFAATMTGAEVYLDGFRRAWEEAGVPFDESLIFDVSQSIPPALPEAIRRGVRPDVFLLHTRHRAEVLGMLQKCGVDFRRECRVISNIAAAKIPGFAGWCHEQPYDETAAAVVDTVDRLLAGDGRVEHVSITSQRIPINLDDKE